MSFLLVLVTFAVLFLAYSNGANDNFKGVATLFGSGTATYGRALAWATVTTGAGSLLALALANSLLDKFKGKGLVPDSVIAQPEFVLAVALGGRPDRAAGDLSRHAGFDHSRASQAVSSGLA